MVMKKRRNRTPRRARVGLFSPAVGLVLWLGFLAIGVFSLGETPDRTAAKVEEPAPETQQAQGGNQAPELAIAQVKANPEPRLRAPKTDAPAADAPDTDVRADKPLTGRARPDRTEAASINEDASGHTSSDIADAQTPPETPASSEIETEPSDDAATDTEAADVAKLEDPVDTADEVSSASVARAQFTTGIEAREPVDRVGNVFHAYGEPVRYLYYFTDIEDMAGETVTHYWEYEGKVIAAVPFEIGSPRWRTWSSKELRLDMAGDWRVIVTDSEGQVISTDSFVYKR